MCEDCMKCETLNQSICCKNCDMMMLCTYPCEDINDCTKYTQHKLFNDDFLNNDLKNESVDLIVTDPPYKLNKTTGSTTSSSKQDKWAGNLISGDKTANIYNNIKFKDWLSEVYRILKKQSHFYVFVNDKNVQDMLNEATKVGFKLHNILVWHKNNKTPNRWYMKNCEFILFFHKGKSFPINLLESSQLLSIQNIHGKYKLHPTQKPVELLSQIILNSSQEHDVVLDPFMGSGSTGIACVNTNRNFIGIEIDENYFNIATKRIEEAQQKVGE